MKKEDAIKYLQQIYPNGGHCWLDEQRIEAIGMAVKALQEEPESIWHAANEKSDNPEDIVIINPSDNTGAVLTKCISVYQGRIWAYTSVLLNIGNPCKIRKNIQEEPVSEDLGDYINELSKQFPEVSFAKLSRIAVRVAKWQMAQMVKDATDVTVHVEAGGYPYIPQMELYDYDKDIPLAKEGDKYKVVLIKEE